MSVEALPSACGLFAERAAVDFHNSMSEIIISMIPTKSGNHSGNELEMEIEILLESSRLLPETVSVVAARVAMRRVRFDRGVTFEDRLGVCALLEGSSPEAS